MEAAGNVPLHNAAYEGWLEGGHASQQRHLPYRASPGAGWSYQLGMQSKHIEGTHTTWRRCRHEAAHFVLHTLRL